MNSRRLAAATGATLLAAGSFGLVTGLSTSVADPKQPREVSVMTSVSERSVSRQRAAKIADRTIERRTGKSARVTGIGREDDFGAQWEVEVTLRSGREFDVYVNRAGQVVKVINKGFDR